MLWEPMTWNLGLGMWPKPRIFHCHRFGQPIVHCVLDWNSIYVLRQRPQTTWGARTKWPKGQDMVACGPEQNDLRLPRVPRCSSLIIIPYMEPKAKTFGYPRVKAQKIFLPQVWATLWFTLCWNSKIWFNTKTLSCMGARTMWFGVQDIVAWGLQQNDLGLPRVPRYTYQLDYNSIGGVQGKDLRLSKGQSLKDNIAIGLNHLWSSL